MSVYLQYVEFLEVAAESSSLYLSSRFTIILLLNYGAREHKIYWKNTRMFVTI
jgi:hypothetical protein